MKNNDLNSIKYKKIHKTVHPHPDNSHVAVLGLDTYFHCLDKRRFFSDFPGLGALCQFSTFIDLFSANEKVIQRRFQVVSQTKNLLSWQDFCDSSVHDNVSIAIHLVLFSGSPRFRHTSLPVTSDLFSVSRDVVF